MLCKYSKCFITKLTHHKAFYMTYKVKYQYFITAGHWLILHYGGALKFSKLQ